MLGYYLASTIGIEKIKGRHVVELGAGCGLSGIVAAHFAQSVATTDGNEVVVDLLRRNAESCHHQASPQEKTTTTTTTNSSNCCTVHASLFEWGDQAQFTHLLKTLDGHVDVVIAADVVQWPDVL